jgi:hypothetical protein
MYMYRERERARARKRERESERGRGRERERERERAREKERAREGEGEREHLSIGALEDSLHHAQQGLGSLRDTNKGSGSAGNIVVQGHLKLAQVIPRPVREALCEGEVQRPHARRYFWRVIGEACDDFEHVLDELGVSILARRVGG